MERILVVEDTDPLREVLCAVLEREGFSVVGAPSAEVALELIGAHEYSCVLADFKLPQMNGLELLAQVRSKTPNLPFVMMTAFGTIEIAVQAMKNGANDFISKPFEPAKLAPMLREVISYRRIITRSSREIALPTTGLESKSVTVQRIYAQAAQAARVETSILILGESGTGKEVLARFIHENSPRGEKPFVAINCSAIPADLLESEFFGHDAGAFTGATQSRVGLLELASEGTIFLDEVGEMPHQLQVKLLRALQEREIRRLGGTKYIPVNPRIVTATNRHIDPSPTSGVLREDFYYRVAVITLTLPKLTERREDIEDLARYFIEGASLQAGKSACSIDPVAMDILVGYPWPGNIRELQNVIERSVILADDIILPEHLGIMVKLDIGALNEASRTLPEIAAAAVRGAEVDAIKNALAHTNGNKSKAALMLGVSYKTLLNKVREYELGSPNPEQDLLPLT